VTVEHYYDNFKTVVASAPRDGYTPYWLGREFTANSLMFRGPYVDDFTDVLGGGAQFHYDATVPGVGPVDLMILVFSERAWVQSPLNRPPTPGARQTAVVVGTHAGQLTTFPGPAGMPEGLLLELRLDTTTVLAIVPASFPLPNPNPLIDEQTFLDVMQNLRPYPQ
jgi:hypothetical protein